MQCNYRKQFLAGINYNEMWNLIDTLMTKSQTTILIKSNVPGIPGSKKDYFRSYNGCSTILHVWLTELESEEGGMGKRIMID